MKYLKKALAIPVGILAIVMMILESPTALVWYVICTVTAKVGSGLPPDLIRLRMPHWYLGRLWEHLWRGRPWR